MKRLAICAFAILASLFVTDSLYAQEKSQQEKSQKEDVATNVSELEGPVAKVQVVFNEYDGQKKVQSLPYTLLVGVGSNGKQGPLSKIRMGSRVPITTGPTPSQFQYVDVGTNVDCRATMGNDGRYRLSLLVERSWPELEGSSEPKVPAASSEAFHQPVIRQFRSDSDVFLREGQTIETNVATDPVTGKVTKIEVSLNLVK
jgi:hypothetical protein